MDCRAPSSLWERCPVAPKRAIGSSQPSQYTIGLPVLCVPGPEWKPEKTSFGAQARLALLRVGWLSAQTTLPLFANCGQVIGIEESSRRRSEESGVGKGG